MNWFAQKQFTKAMQRLQTQGEMSYDEIKKIVWLADVHDLGMALSDEVYHGRLAPRYDYTKPNGTVKSNYRLTDFGDAIDFINDVTVVYVATNT